jgi:hypothetical protein
MKHIVNFSGGACAFWAAHRVIAQHGTKDVTLLFADVLIEDEDLYAFNKWSEGILGVPITRVCDGRTPWQVFREEGFIGNSRTAICSMRLKREPLDLWHRQNALEMDSTIYLGFDATEWNRLKDIRAKRPAWRIEAPMTEPPLWDKCKIIDECAKLGFPKQKLYELGFPHNNCGGRCVTAGISHWVHLLKVLPDRYLEWENEEQVTMADFDTRGIEFKTMLKDRRGGITKNLSLKDLRIRVESGETFDRHDWGGCGCAANFH